MFETNMIGILKNVLENIIVLLSKYAWFFKREAYVYNVGGYNIKEVKRTY